MAKKYPDARWREQRTIRALDDLVEWAEHPDTMLYAHDRKLINNFVKLISDLRVSRRKEFLDDIQKAITDLDAGRSKATVA